MYRWKSSILLGLLLVVAAVGGGNPEPAHAATTRVWTGAVNLTWSTAGNWDPAGPPVDGDSVIIGAPAFGKTLNNNRPADIRWVLTVRRVRGPLHVTSGAVNFSGEAMH